MTALAAALETAKKDGLLSEALVVASTKIYKGAPVFKKGSGSNKGYAFSPDGSTNTLAVGDVFIGIAYETIDNSAGANGAQVVRVEKTGSFLLPVSDSITAAYEGAPAYVNNTQNDAKVTITSADAGSAQAQVGVIDQYVSASSAYVRIDNFVDQAVGQNGAVNTDPTASAISNAKYAEYVYDFAVLGGAISTITLTGPKLPVGAIVLDGIVDVITAPVGSGASIALRLQGANDIISVAAISGAPWSTTGLKDVVPVGTAATAVRVASAAKGVSAVVTGAALTDGKFKVILRYVNA